MANAQAAGAVGAIIVNNAGNTVFDMAGDNPEIVIPSVMVGSRDGNRIRQEACGESAAYFLGDRFQVTAAWRAANGTSGEGQAVELTDQSGYFYFFNEENIEITIKMLDACEIGSFNSFWFFGAAMTDVEVALTVVDTQSGLTKTYSNELKTPFDPILDTSAFATCP